VQCVLCACVLSCVSCGFVTSKLSRPYDAHRRSRQSEASRNGVVVAFLELEGRETELVFNSIYV